MGSFTDFVIQLLFCRSPIGAAALLFCNTILLLQNTDQHGCSVTL